MATNEHNQKGPQAQAEGQHGDKTHQAFIDGLQKPQDDEGGDEVPREGSPYGEKDSDGRHRLRENRQQHDEADKNSDKNRLDRMKSEP